LQVTFVALVVVVEILFKFAPNQLDKFDLNFTDAVNHRFWLELLLLDGLVNDFKASSKVLADEVYVLLE
jgi:hypothetical protein